MTLVNEANLVHNFS